LLASQLAKPALQTPASQEPLAHAAVMFCVLHGALQAPQWLASLLGLTSQPSPFGLAQSPLQSKNPVLHAQ
jgi:hypothetical protein